MSFSAYGSYQPVRKEAYVTIDMPGPWIGAIKQDTNLTNFRDIDYTKTRHIETFFLRSTDTEPCIQKINVNGKVYLKFYLERLNYSGVFEHVVDPGDMYLHVRNFTSEYRYNQETDEIGHYPHPQYLDNWIKAIRGYYNCIHNYPLHNIKMILDTYRGIKVLRVNDVCLINYSKTNGQPNWIEVSDWDPSPHPRETYDDRFKIRAIYPLTHKSLEACYGDDHTANNDIHLYGNVGWYEWSERWNQYTGKMESIRPDSLLELQFDGDNYKFHSRQDVFDVVNHLYKTVPVGCLSD